MNINIKILETLRDEKEIREYFLSKNVNITNEEIYKLKESYNQTTNLSDNELSYEQLDGVAGGILYVFDKKVYSTLRDEKPEDMPQHVWQAAQDLMSMQLDTYMNAIKFAYDLRNKLAPNYEYAVIIPPILQINSKGNLRFLRVSYDTWEETHLKDYVSRYYPEKLLYSFPSVNLERLIQDAYNDYFEHPSAMLDQHKEKHYYDASSPEAFELWQIAAAHIGLYYGQRIAITKVYPKTWANMENGLPCFIHKVYKEGTFDCLYAHDIRYLFTSEHYDKARRSGYVDQPFSSDASIYGRFAYNDVSLSADDYLKLIPHDQMPSPDKGTVTSLSSPRFVQTYRYHILPYESKQTSSVSHNKVETKSSFTFSLSDRIHFFP